jgi:hypothetical protein
MSERQPVEQKVEVQHAGLRPPLFDRPADAVVIERAWRAEPPGQTVRRAHIVAGEQMQTSEAA